MEMTRPARPAAATIPLVRLAVRACLLLVAFAIAIVAWPAFLGRAGAAGPALAPDRIGAALGWSLGVLTTSLVLAAVAGLLGGAVGGLVDRLEPDQPWTAGVVKLAGRAVQVPWVALSPAVLAALLASRLGSPATAPVVLLLTLAGLPAILAAAAAYDLVRRGAWLAGACAGLAALGRGLVAAASGMAVAEPVVGAPGLGRLLDVAAARGAAVQLAVPFLVLALAGSLAALLGDGLTALWSPAPDLEPADEAAARGWMGLALAGLALPLLLLVAALVAGAGGPPRVDFSALQAAPSGAHPLGTDRLGRDLLALGLAGLGASIRESAAATALAVAGGLVWGGCALLVARLRGLAGDVGADLVVAPARVLALMPLLPAVVLLAGSGIRGALLPGLGLGLAARLALGLRDLGLREVVAGAAGPAPLLARAAAGLLLLCLGVAFVAHVGLGAAGVAGRPPEPSLGALVGDPSGLAAAAWLCALFAAPCVLAGWALLRPFRRAQAWARLAG
jgi:ABC-type dipeptide/oligopeptide/nickel transport system permease subunit